MVFLDQEEIQALIRRGLQEDAPYGDLASQAIFKGQFGQVDLIAKEAGIFCGQSIFEAVFSSLQEDTKFNWRIEEGASIQPGQVLVTVSALATTLLTGERLALNFIQRLSGIATATHRFVTALDNTGIKLMDTRKTTPGLRQLEKYAVRVGGGYNHRFGLSDLIMLKDNHIAAAGGILPAVELVRQQDPYMHKIEVEVENLDMVDQALQAKVDIIMLDNMSIEQMTESLQRIDGRAIVEASGNITLDNCQDLAHLGLDYISSGSITHSAGILDLSMKHFRVI